MYTSIDGSYDSNLTLSPILELVFYKRDLLVTMVCSLTGQSFSTVRGWFNLCHDVRYALFENH